MIPPTHAQRKLLAFIQAEAREGRVPSYQEMVEGTGVRGKARMREAVHSLIERGHVTAEYAKPRSVRVLVNSGGQRFTFEPVEKVA